VACDSDILFRINKITGIGGITYNWVGLNDVENMSEMYDRELVEIK
jgi:hypothetical protein